MSTATPPDDFAALKTICDALAPFPQDDRNRLLRWVQEKFGIVSAPVIQHAPQTPTPQTPPTPPQSPPAHSHGPGHGTTDIKSFMEAKSPQSANQFAAAVAYYHRFVAPEAQRKDTITKDDITAACRLVNRKQSKYTAQILVNAHGQGLLDKEERGEYRINSVGENLVAIVLPGKDTGKPRRSSKKSAKKPASQKKSGRKGK